MNYNCSIGRNLEYSVQFLMVEGGGGGSFQRKLTYIFTIQASLIIASIEFCLAAFLVTSSNY